MVDKSSGLDAVSSGSAGTITARKPGWAGWATLVAAAAATITAGAAAVGVFLLYNSIHLAASGVGKPAYQALCLTYSDFVLTQAHNGYTPEQIQRVIDFAGSHRITTNPDGPDYSAMPNRWPTISDEKACGTPTQILDHAK